MMCKAGSRCWCLLMGMLVASCATPPPPSHPAGELYVTPQTKPQPLPSTENDPNGGAN